MPLPISQSLPLPKALQPWQTWLNWLAPELVPAFSESLQRLSRVFGPIQGRQLGGEPEQDGLGLIERKGDYQHLLLSEWLIADEVPDEFIRRAINSEHLFLTPNYKIEQSLNQITVLFDSGPFQLGACRLVHIALLILLAQRAEQAGCSFMWGILQSPSELMPFENINHLQALLKRRTLSPVLSEHVEKWDEYTKANTEMNNGELWVVSAPHQEHLLSAISATHRVELNTDDAEQKTIDADIYNKSYHRHVNLPMPPETLSIQLLKGMLRHTTVQNTYNDDYKISLMIPPTLSFHGSCVAVALLGKPGFAVIKIPPQNQTSNKTIKNEWTYQLYPSRHSMSILALQGHGKKIGALFSSNEILYFWQLPKLSNLKKPPKNDFFASSSRAGVLTSAFLVGRERNALFVLDIDKKLVFFSPNHHINGYQALRENVIGMEKIADDVLAYVYIEDDTLVQVIVNTSLSQQRHQLSFSATISNKLKVLFAYRHKYARGWNAVTCAVSTQLRDHECWRLYDMSGMRSTYSHTDVSFPSGWHAIGLYYQDKWGNVEDLTQINFLLLNQNKRNIACFSGGIIHLYSANSAIARYTFSPVTGLLAMLTQDKQLIIYDVYHHQLRLSSFSIVQQEIENE